MPTESSRPRRLTPGQEAEIERLMRLITPQIHQRVDAMFRPLERKLEAVRGRA